MGVLPAVDRTPGHRDLKRLDGRAIMQKHWQTLDQRCDQRRLRLDVPRDHLRRPPAHPRPILCRQRVPLPHHGLVRDSTQGLRHWLKGERSQVQKGWLEALTTPRAAKAASWKTSSWA